MRQYKLNTYLEYTFLHRAYAIAVSMSRAGSYFCDGAIRTGGFDGEGIQSSSVVAIKSHSFTPFWTTELGKLERDLRLGLGWIKLKVRAKLLR